MSLHTMSFSIVLLTMTFPIVSFAAASPQEILSRALTRIEGQPIHESGTLDFTLTDRTHAARTSYGRIDGRGRLESRSVKREDHSLDSETTVALTSIRVKQHPETLSSFFNGPSVITWRSVSGTAYVRPEGEVLHLLSAFLPSLASQPSTWISMPPSGINDLPLLGVSLGDKYDVLRGKPFLRVTKQRSTYQRGDHRILRLQAKASEAMLSAMQKEETKKWKTTVSFINEKYRVLRETLLPVTFIADVDATDERLLRLEVAGTAAYPQQACTTASKKQKTVCKSDGSLSLRYAATIDFLDEDLTPILAPTSSTSIDQLLDAVTNAHASGSLQTR